MDKRLKTIKMADRVVWVKESGMLAISKNGLRSLLGCSDGPIRKQMDEEGYPALPTGCREAVWLSRAVAFRVVSRAGLDVERLGRAWERAEDRLLGMDRREGVEPLLGWQELTVVKTGAWRYDLEDEVGELVGQYDARSGVLDVLGVRQECELHGWGLVKEYDRNAMVGHWAGLPGRSDSRKWKPVRWKSRGNWARAGRGWELLREDRLG